MKTAVARLKGIDSNKFENMYSGKDAIRYEDIRVSDISFEEIEPFLHKLPPREIDLLTLYRKYGKNQKDIARMFSVTQGAVSSRLKRALDRLRFLRDMPKITDEDIEHNLSGVFDSIEVEIIKCMKETTCQSRTAEIINERFGLADEKRRMTQVKVRHRFEKCLAQLDLMRKSDSNLERFYNLLVVVKKNLYILHEVVLPHFDRGRYALFSMTS